jgi:hypothetical protein
MAPGRRDPLGSRLNVLLAGSLRHAGLTRIPLSCIIAPYRRAPHFSAPWAKAADMALGCPRFPCAEFRLTRMPWCPSRTVESLIRIAAKWAISQVLGCGYAGICAHALSQLPRCAYLLATGFPIIAMRRIVKWRTRVRTCVSHVDHELQGSIPLQGIETASPIETGGLSALARRA